MVCKEDVVTWFQALQAHKRIDVMCSLIDVCLPFEVRFFGTCLEDIGRQSFHKLREADIKANNPASDFSDLQRLRDQQSRRLLALQISLLRSCNHICSNSLHKILQKLDLSEINAIMNDSPSDDSPLDDLLVLYTLAINHPAFSFEQKSVYGSILESLHHENSKRLLLTKPLSIGLVYHNPPLQPCVPCPIMPEETTLPESHCMAMGPTIVPTAPLPPPGLGLPPGLTLPSDPMPPTSYMHVPYASPSHQPVSSLPWQTGISPVIMSSLCGEPTQGGVDGAPYPPSPLVSRPASPAQSMSPSGAGSPLPATDLGYPKGGRRSDKTPMMSLRHDSIDTSIAPPPLQLQLNVQKNSEQTDLLHETLEKEMPNYISSLQNYSVDELKGMRDDQLNNLGLASGAITQLRNIFVKLQNTNGICNLDKRDMTPVARRKHDGPSQELKRNQPQVNPYGGRSYGGVPMDPQMMYPPPPPMMSSGQGGQTFTCMAVPAPAPYPNQMYCMDANMRGLRLDAEPVRHNSNSSSGSNSSSASHSPPETPSITAAASHWDRGFSTKELSATERSSPGCDDRAAEPAPPPDPAHSASSRLRPVTGLGRSRATPPGVPMVARGRGHKPVTVILDNQKLPSSCRRDGPPVNGLQPSARHPMRDDRAPFSPYAAAAPPPPHFAPCSRAGETNNVPYTPVTAFLPHSQYHPMRTTASIYQPFPQSGYLRQHGVAYQPNGELLFQYHPQQSQPPPPQGYMQAAVPAYSPVYPPPKVSCFNCGKHHHASECKESTMEEVAQPGQYHLDYTPYQKPGECSSEK